MSEDRPPVYIRCASGNNSHTDCVIRRHGDNVEILGHPLMCLTPEDAVYFATSLLHAADAAGYPGTQDSVASLRSEIAKALHSPVMADNLSRPLLEECSEALAYQEREADYWRREWHEAQALYWAETDDGK